MLVMSATLDGAAVATAARRGAGRRRAKDEPSRSRRAGEAAPASDAGDRRGARATSRSDVARTIRASARRGRRRHPRVPAGPRRDPPRAASARRGGSAAARAQCCRSSAICRRESRTQRFARPTRGERKVVLATNIAETSLTIEGVRIVIDSGLARRSRFDPATGMSRLETVRISRASADQRRGRAGRLEAGVCYRLWSESEHACSAGADAAGDRRSGSRAARARARGLGRQRPADAALARSAARRDIRAGARPAARARCARSRRARSHAHGRALARLGTHPRLAHMIVRGAELGTAAHRARDRGRARRTRSAALRRGPRRDVDLRLRIEALRHGGRDLPRRTFRSTAARGSARCAASNCSNGKSTATRDRECAARRCGHRPPARIRLSGSHRAIARRGGRYLLSSGRGARLPDAQSLAQAEFLVVADLDAGDRDALIRLAAPIARAALEADFAERIEHRERFEWDSREQAVVAQDERWLGASEARRAAHRTIPTAPRDERCTAGRRARARS